MSRAAGVIKIIIIQKKTPADATSDKDGHICEGGMIKY